MKKYYKGIIFVCIFLLSFGIFFKIFKNPDLSPAHTSKTVPEKIYSEKLSKLCSNLIHTNFNELPENVIIPTDNISVYLLDSTAIVDFRKLPDFSGNFEFEQVFIYSIVNILTKEDGVMTVEFTVNGKSEPSYNGGIDMSETFIPDYDLVFENNF